MVFINTTGLTYTIIQNMNSYVTNSEYITYSLIFIAILMMCVLLRIPIEFSALLIFPLLIALVAFNVGSFVFPLIIALFFIGILIAKNWLFSER